MTAVVILLAAAVLAILFGVALGFALARAAALPTPPPPHCPEVLPIASRAPGHVATCFQPTGHDGPHTGFVLDSTNVVTWDEWGDDDSA